MPPLNGAIELCGLQARDLEVRAQPAALERAQALLEPAPWTGEDRHVLRKNGARPGGRLLPELVDQSHRLVADPEEQQRDQGGGERPGPDPRPDVILDQPRNAVRERAKR